MIYLSKRPVTLLIVIAGLAFLFSCIPDHYDPDKLSDEISLSPSIAAPLAYGTLSVEDMIDLSDSNSYVKHFDDSLLYITYYENLMSYPASEVIDIPDQNFLEMFISPDINIPSWLISTLGDTVEFTKTKSAEFVFSHHERIDSINVKTATLNIDVKSTFRHTGILTIHSDHVLIDGEPFHEVIQISDASGNFTYNADIPIDGSVIYLENSHSDTTILPLTFELQLINSGNAVLTSQSCDITMSFNNIEFNSAFGYLGDYNVLLKSGQVDIDLFGDSTIEGKLLFADPRFTMEVKNSYGVPLQIELSDVNAYSEINDVTTPITFSGVNPFTINSPGIDRVGDTAVTLITINKDNCNIVDAMETQPKSFTYSVTAITNPGGNGMYDNFVTDTSDLSVDFEVVLPIWINADGFSMEDTIDFDFEKEVGSDVDMIDYFRLTLDAKNGIPMQVNMQVYFADENYHVIDSLFTDDDLLLEAAPVDSNDKVNGRAELSKMVEFTQARLEAVKPTKYAMVRASVNTRDAASGRYVKFFSYYNVDFKLKMKADVTISTENSDNN